MTQRTDSFLLLKQAVLDGLSKGYGMAIIPESEFCDLFLWVSQFLRKGDCSSKTFSYSCVYERSGNFTDRVYLTILANIKNDKLVLVETFEGDSYGCESTSCKNEKTRTLALE